MYLDIRLLDNQVDAQFANNELISDFPSTPTPHPHILLNPKEVNKELKFQLRRLSQLTII